MDSYLTNTHPRVRSFLSPTQKYGQRSLSTSDSPHYFSRTDLHASSHNNFSKKNNTHQKIKLDDYRKGGTFIKGSKLQKCGVKGRLNFENKNDWEREKSYQNAQTNDLHMLIRQLKNKACRFQAQNTELKKKQQTDLDLIRRQNQTIIMLREVLSNQASKQKYRPPLDLHFYSTDYVKQMGNSFQLDELLKTRNTLDCEQCRKIEFSDDRIHQIAFQKIKEERNSLREQYKQLMIKYQQLNQQFNDTKENDYRNRQKNQRNNSFDQALKKLRDQRNRQIEEIDNVLFSNQY